MYIDQLQTPHLWPQIKSVAIPMASSCSIDLHNISNSQFWLLPILPCTCGGQFGNRLRLVSVPFSAPGPCQNPCSPWACWAKWHQLHEKGLVTQRFPVTGSSETPSLWTALIMLYKISAIPTYVHIHSITLQQGYLHCNVCPSCKTNTANIVSMQFEFLALSVHTTP